MRFVIDRTSVQPTFNNNLPPLTSILLNRHNSNNLQIDFVKKLTEYDVTRGYLVLLYQGHCEQMLDRGATSVKSVDDCGNVWECILIFGIAPYDHCRIGGQWKRFVDERNLYECVKIRLGAPAAATMKQHMCRFIAVKVGVHEAGIC